MDPVDNVPVRTAVAAFAARSEQRTLLDVLRACMTGRLLLDTTGSGPGAPFGAGSTLQIAGGTGPDGGRALFAFTRQEEIARRHPPGTPISSLAQSAVDVLGMVRANGDPWLYLDPAGPTCALAGGEIDFALRNPHNPALKAAVDRGPAGRSEAIALLRSPGPLLLAVDESTGERVPRTSVREDGSRWLFAFTSAPEAAAAAPADGVWATTTTDTVPQVVANGLRGLVINPAGPWLAIGIEELATGAPPR